MWLGAKSSISREGGTAEIVKSHGFFTREIHYSTDRGRQSGSKCNKSQKCIFFSLFFYTFFISRSIPLAVNPRGYEGNRPLFVASSVRDVYRIPGVLLESGREEGETVNGITHSYLAFKMEIIYVLCVSEIRLIKEIWNKNGEYILILCTSGLVIIFAFLTKEIELEKKRIIFLLSMSPPSPLIYRYIPSFRCDSLSDFHFSLILRHPSTRFLYRGLSL